MSLVISGLNLSVGKSHILHDIDLEIGEGEFFSLLGKSGSGKSTLLKTIAGLMREQEGSIVMDGRQLHEQPPQKRETAVVFQDLRLFPNMNVADNITYPLRIKGVSKKRRSVKAERLLELVHLEGFGDRHVRQLSGGQAQRVAIARALAAEPKVLLLDEPFSALDENLRESMRSFISDIHKSTGVTIVMVTHNQNEALSMSDRIAVMSEGKIVQVGTPREIYHNPADLETALYLADAVVLRGSSNGGVFRSAGGIEIPCNESLEHCVAVVRNKALSITEQGQEMVVDCTHYKGGSSELVLRRGSETLCAVVDEDYCAQTGDKVGVSLNMDEIFFFEG